MHNLKYCISEYIIQSTTKGVRVLTQFLTTLIYDIFARRFFAEKWLGITDSKMGTKAKKAMKNMKKASSNKPSQGADFLVCREYRYRVLSVFSLLFLLFFNILCQCGA